MSDYILNSSKETSIISIPDEKFYDLSKTGIQKDSTQNFITSNGHDILKYYIKKQKQKSGSINYYLQGRYKEEGTPKTRILASYGEESPIFYNPHLVRGDSEEYLKTIPKSSVDLIIDDPPYGSTKLPWDKTPNWDVLANLYHNILKDNGLIYVFGKQPSLIEVYNNFNELFDFRFEIIWNRNNVPWTSNFKPLMVHENIFAFCKKGTPVEDTNFYVSSVMTPGKPYSKLRKNKSPTHGKYNRLYLSNIGAKRYPKSILEIPPVNITHSTKEYLGYPTQKPLELIRWLIQASSQKSNVILDPHMGSGTTLLAALWLGRKSIGIELHQAAYNIALNRVIDTVIKLPKRYTIDDTIIDILGTI